MTEALSRDDFLAAMEARFVAKRHSDYPVVKAIYDGTATREQIGYLAVMFYHFTKWTPQVLSTIHSRCDDRTIRRRIMDTLIDEDTELRCGNAGHDQLALDFATRFTGMSEEEVEAHPIPNCVREMTAYRFKVASEMPVVIALGNSGVASESHAPEMCRMISDGLREHFGVVDEDQESWIVHIEGDEQHSETAFTTVLEYCTSSDLQKEMFWCIDTYLSHWGNFWREAEKGDVRKAGWLKAAS
ncbi:MAG TPA: iron-containing redox enzyme family protein [Alphaproteobacteria bacterium]|nr:iron-containing redox enzyme family protein [Alphaproteobacteria bacterium]